MKHHALTPSRLRHISGPWFHKQFHAYPLTLGTAGDGVVRFGLKLLPWSMPYGACFYTRGIADWYWNRNEQLRNRKKSIAAQLRNPRFIARIDSARGRSYQQFNKNHEHFSALNLRSLSDQAPWTAYERILEPCLRVWGWGVVSEPFLGDEEDWLVEALRPELEQRFGRRWTKVLNVLTAPTFQSFVQREHRSLLSVAAGVAKHRKVLRMLKRTPRRAYRIAMSDPALKRMVVRHTTEFSWIEDNYSVFRNLGERTFSARAAELATQHPVVILRQEYQRERRERIAKRQVLKQLSERARRLVVLADTLASSSDQRKSSTFRMARVWFTIAKETARRRKITLTNALHMTNAELRSCLLNNVFDRTELQRRRYRCLVIYDASGEHVYTGRAMAGLTPEHFEDVHRATSVIRGVSASPGFATGRVRIVRTHHEIALVKVGEVLVTNNTTPDFVRAMRRAAAIVTEQGGITSHAAVVSRELGVPCVIGTRIATRILKTGDRVEVDATRGIIQKL